MEFCLNGGLYWANFIDICSFDIDIVYLLIWTSIIATKCRSWCILLNSKESFELFWVSIYWVEWGVWPFFIIYKKESWKILKESINNITYIILFLTINPLLSLLQLLQQCFPKYHVLYSIHGLLALVSYLLVW